jgi:hypothetical protein
VNEIHQDPARRRRFVRYGLPTTAGKMADYADSLMRIRAARKVIEAMPLIEDRISAVRSYDAMHRVIAAD